MSDFSLFGDAGFEVAVCGGPDDSTPCPLTEGRRCRLADAADVVLFGLNIEDETGLSVLRGHHQQHPDTPVIVAPPRDGTTLVDRAVAFSVLPGATTVAGQVTALWKALNASQWTRAARPPARTRHGMTPRRTVGDVPEPSAVRPAGEEVADERSDV